jgi:hypothetical protein
MVQIMPKMDTSLFCQILVPDGHSKVGSADYARSLGYDVHIQNKKGIRFACIEDLPKIIGDYVITFSPNGNCPPEDLPKPIQKLEEGFDMLVASRYLPRAKSHLGMHFNRLQHLDKPCARGTSSQNTL